MKSNSLRPPSTPTCRCTAMLTTAPAPAGLLRHCSCTVPPPTTLLLPPLLLLAGWTAAAGGRPGNVDAGLALGLLLLPRGATCPGGGTGDAAAASASWGLDSSASTLSPYVSARRCARWPLPAPAGNTTKQYHSQRRCKYQEWERNTRLSRRLRHNSSPSPPTHGHTRLVYDPHHSSGINLLKNFTSVCVQLCQGTHQSQSPGLPAAAVPPLPPSAPQPTAPAPSCLSHPPG